MSIPTARVPQHWRQLWTRMPFFVWLVVLWMLLWGQFTVLAAVTGVAIAAFVVVTFRLPTVELSGRVNLWYLTSSVFVFAYQLVLGALVVVWQTIRPRVPQSAVVRVPLMIDDDLVMTTTAIISSLIPGSLAVEADRENRVLYLHALGVDSEVSAAQVRRNVQRWEERVVLATGSSVQVAIIRSGAEPYRERAKGIIE